MKFMSMQMLRPWALQCIMGNGVTPVQFRCQNHNNNIKLFKFDGEICIYDAPVKASQLMIEFPNHMICRSDSFYIGQKIPPLSEHDHLQLGHNYFLLPTHFFQSVLSFVTIASFASSSGTSSSPASSSSLVVGNKEVEDTKMKAAFLKKAAASTCPPFDMQKTGSGALTIRVSGEFISQLMMDRWSVRNNDKLVGLAAEEVRLLCTTPQLQKDYKQLVIGARGHWKPKLEMIRETHKEKKKVKILLSASFGIKRMRKKKSQSSSLSPSTTKKKKAHKTSSSTFNSSDSKSAAQKSSSASSKKPKSEKQSSSKNSKSPEVQNSDKQSSSTTCASSKNQSSTSNSKSATPQLEKSDDQSSSSASLKNSKSTAPPVSWKHSKSVALQLQKADDQQSTSKNTKPAAPQLQKADDQQSSSASSEPVPQLQKSAHPSSSSTNSNAKSSKKRLKVLAEGANHYFDRLSL